MKILTNWMEMRKREQEVREGWRVYSKIKQVYGQDTAICVSQHPALGDAYLAGLYLNSYYGEKQFVVTAIGQGAMEVYQYLEVKQICCLTQRETDCFIIFCQFIGVKQEEVRVLHHQALCWHTGVLWYLQGVKGVTFADMFEAAVFPGADRRDRNYPSVLPEMEEFLTGLEIEKEKTVILFPYANTLHVPETDFWNEVVHLIREKGYKAATYVYEKESPIEGTSAVFCKLDQLVLMAEYAGFVVGVRNGLMDIVGRAKCRKIILYPSKGAEGWIHGSIKDFWSLAGFGYCNDAEEYEYESVKLEEIKW